MPLDELRDGNRRNGDMRCKMCGSVLDRVERRRVRAISLKQPWASMIAEGRKSIETRKWATTHRGEILIVSSKRPTGMGPVGKALALATLVDCRPMRPSDSVAACCPFRRGIYAWVLEDVRRIRPFSVKGRLGLYGVSLPAGCEDGSCGD